MKYKHVSSEKLISIKREKHIENINRLLQRSGGDEGNRILTQCRSVT